MSAAKLQRRKLTPKEVLELKGRADIKGKIRFGHLETIKGVHKPARGTERGDRIALTLLVPHLPLRLGTG